jgi:predicted RNase H-like nuclease (RuvC/YqgF family)
MQLGGNPLVYKNVGQIEETEDSNLFLTSKEPQERQKWIIVGFDPGLTVGIAILDLSGNVISTRSCKEMSRAEVIKHIIRYGKTILIATDVYPPPKMVKKLASLLNSKIYSPVKTFTVSSKTELVDSYLNEISSTKYPENAHERDALAAAIKTYKHYQNKLRQIERRTEKLGLGDSEVDDIKSMVIRGRPISSAIDDILKIPEDTDDLEVQIEEMENDIESIDEEKLKNVEESARKLKQKIKSQERQIKNLKKKNRLLKKDVRYYKKKTSKLEGKIEKLHYDYSKDILRKKEISSKVALIKGLQDKYTEEKERREKLEENLNSIKKIRVMELSKKAVPVKIIESFTREKIRDAQEYWKIKRGDIVLLSSTEGGGSQTASLLIKIGIKAVIAVDKMSHPAEEEFEKNMVPVLDANKTDLEMIDEFAVIERDVLNKEIENWKTRVENKRSKEEKKKLIKVIDEYRAQRRRHLNGD